MNGKSENLAYHGARLLILIRFAGKPRTDPAILPGIEGRTLLAKLDFFLRYPAYLRRASEIIGVSIENPNIIDFDEINSVESRMIRYLYGPWDELYYPVLAYLIGKQLIKVSKKKNTEIFQLSKKGNEIAEQLALTTEYADVTSRAAFLPKLFSKHNGNTLRKFIYENFPDVVNRNIGDAI
jgi:hypothetical protein